MQMQPAKLPTEETYHLKCKIVVKEISFEDEQSRDVKQHTAKMVFLVPLESSQRDFFFSAWLPEDESEAFEVALMLAHPVSGPCRAAVMRKNKRLNEHHLFVMSVGAEEDLIQEAEKKKWNLFKDRVIEVTVLPETDDRILDLSKDPNQRAGIHKTY